MIDNVKRSDDRALKEMYALWIKVGPERNPGVHHSQRFDHQKSIHQSLQPESYLLSKFVWSEPA